MWGLLRIAFRNVFRQKRRSLLTGLMMVGGFTLSCLSIGISDGSYGHLIDLFTRNQTGHVQIHRAGYLDRPSLWATIDDLDTGPAPVLDGETRVTSWAPRLKSPALAFRDTKTSGAYIVGVDPVREASTTRLAERVTAGRFFTLQPDSLQPDLTDDGGRHRTATDAGGSAADVMASDDHIPVLLDHGLARILGVGIGDDIVLIAQGADGSIAHDLFSVTGLVGRAGQAGLGLTCYMPLVAAQDFLALQGRVHEITLVLDDPRHAESVAHDLATHLDPQLQVSPWQVVEEEFYRAMLADVEGMWLSLLVIILIVAIGVLNTVLMTILERTREFGVLRALGTRPTALFSLIVLETSILAMLSLLPAMLLGTGLNYWLSQAGIMLPEAVEVGGVYFDRMYGEVNARSLWLPAAVVLLTAILVSILPALRAARIVPVEAMRAN